MSVRIAKAVFLFLALIITTVSSSHDLIQPQDIPEDPCLGCQSFPDTKSAQSDFSNFAIILALNDTTVLVGTRNALMFMTRDGQYKAYVAVDNAGKCAASNPEICSIDFIMKDGNGLMVCGKLAGQRNCWSITGMTSKSALVGQYYPQGEFAYLDGDEYLYTAFQNENGNGKLLKQNLENPSQNVDKLFINPTYPEFLSIYVFGDFIYYFFREQQEEVQDPNKIVYSRVARLCKYDTGGPSHTPLKSQLTLFSKARLLCEKKIVTSTFKHMSVHYNILEKTSFVKSKDGKIHIYGLFKSADPYVDLSVICRFSLAEIDNIFESLDYYKKKDGVLTHSVRQPQDPRLTEQCNSSLDTTKLKYSTLKLAAASSLTLQAVKPDGDGPVLELESSRISHIAAKSVDTNIGDDSIHILHMIDSNVIYNAAVPSKLGGKAERNIYSKQMISEEPLKVLDFKQIEGNLFVGSMSKIVVVPDDECSMYKTCRECIRARNPHCGWHDLDDSCQPYNHSIKSAFKQDMANGDFGKLCKKENARCVLSIHGEPSLNSELRLQLTMSGVPGAQFVSLEQDGSDINLTSSDFEMTKTRDQVEFVFKKFGLRLAGNYTCHVDNSWSKGSCSVVVSGSLPEITCRRLRKKSWLINCTGTGHPTPKMRFNVLDNSGDLIKSVSDNEIQVEPNKSYLGIVENEFGASVGKMYKLFSKQVEFGLNRTWKNGLANTESASYKMLKNDVIKQVKTLYQADMPLDIRNVRFREGSCVVSFTVSGVASSKSDIEKPIETAIRNGKMGDMNIYEHKDPTKTVPTKDHQSTSSVPQLTTVYPTKLPSTPHTVPSGLPLSFPPSTDNRPSNNTTASQGTPAPGTGDREGCEGGKVSLVTFIVVLIILLLVIFVLLFIVAYICGMDLYFCKRLDRNRSRESGCDLEEEMDGLPRSKVRESRRKLLHQNEEKKPTPTKSPNNLQKHAGSVEIKNDQSTC